MKKTRLSLGSRRENKPQLTIPNTEVEFKQHHTERRFSLGSWNRKKAIEKLNSAGHLSPVLSMPSLATPEKTNKESYSTMQELYEIKSDGIINTEDINIDNYHKIEDKESSFVKVPRNEYEEFKDRVIALESKISEEFHNQIKNDSFVEPVVNGPNSVQEKFEKVVEQTNPLNEVASVTDSLAKRLSRDLKIRQSVEQQVIRSPSARKIGTMRRRSRDSGARLSRSTTWHCGSMKHLDGKIDDFTKESLTMRSNLKRGRPNTYIRHPSPVRKSNSTVPIEKSVEEQWQDAKSFFKDPENDAHDMSVDMIVNDGSPLVREISITTPETSISNVFSNVFRTPANVIPRPSSRSQFKTMGNLPTSVSIDNTPMLPPNLALRRVPSHMKKTPNTHIKVSNAMLAHSNSAYEMQTGRASIARIRANVGHVAAKARLFDNMCGKNDDVASVTSKPFNSYMKPSQVSETLYDPQIQRTPKENHISVVDSPRRKESTPKRKQIRVTTEAARRHKLRLLQPSVIRSPININKQRKSDNNNATKLQSRLEDIRLKKRRLSEFEEIVSKRVGESNTPKKRSQTSLSSKTPKAVNKTPTRSRGTPGSISCKSPRFTVTRK